MPTRPRKAPPISDRPLLTRDAAFRYVRETQDLPDCVVDLDGDICTPVGWTRRPGDFLTLEFAIVRPRAVAERKRGAKP